MRLFFLLLLPLALAGPARAQAPVAPPALIPRAHAAALPDAVLFADPSERGASGVEQDTTSPWRYYPLHVGDTWEYYRYQGTFIERYVVTGTAVYQGHRYAQVAFYGATDGEPLEYAGTAPFRFDTTASRVWVYDTVAQQDNPYFGAGCPFDAAFGSTVQCFYGTTAVSGGTALFVLGGPFPGTGTDTLSVAYKRFVETTSGIDERFVVDVGFAYSYVAETGDEVGLTFYRVNGVSRGYERYPGANGPVDVEGAPEGDAAVSVSVSPNPVRGRAAIALTLAVGGPVMVEVYDLLGRRGAVLADGAVSAGRHTLTLDAAGLAPGIYVVRAVVTAGPTPTRVLTQRLTVAR